MSDVKHTAEPWRLSGKSKRVVHYGYDSFTVNSEANARRIVACVNALQGVPTEFLEKAVQMGITDVSKGNLFSSRVELQSQRDQLLEVLEMVRDSGDWFASALELNMDVDGCDLLAVIEKSIAAVKGEK